MSDIFKTLKYFEPYAIYVLVIATFLAIMKTYHGAQNALELKEDLSQEEYDKLPKRAKYSKRKWVTHLRRDLIYLIVGYLFWWTTKDTDAKIVALGYSLFLFFTHLHSWLEHNEKESVFARFILSKINKKIESEDEKK